MKLSTLAGKPAARDSAGMPRRGLAIWLYAAVLMLAVAAVVAVLLWNADNITTQLREQAQIELAARDAQIRLARLEQQLRTTTTTLHVLAAQQPLIEALEQGAPERLAALERDYRGVLPEALRLALLPAGIDEPDLGAKPPIGYALLDMLREAEQQQTAPPPEVHLPGQPEAHVNLLQPVIGASGVVGHVLASYPLSWLQQPLRGGGGAALMQGGVSVVRVGALGGAQTRLPVPATDWQLIYAAPVVAIGPDSADLVLPLVLLAVLLLLIVGMFYRLQRQLPHADGPGDPVPAATPVPAEPSPPPDSPTAVGASPPVEPPLAAATPGLVAEAEAEPEPSAEPTTTEATLPPPASSVDPSILRAYDIRGIVGAGLTVDVVRALGRAIATEAAAAGQQEIVVARDGRLSSPELSQALIDGLVASGRQVVDVGQVPTPVMHFATVHLGTDAGVMVTGSHNPSDYNGLKIVIGGRTLSGDAIQALGQRVQRDEFIDGQGSVRSVDILPDYIDRITADITLQRPLRIVVDCGNGVAGAVAPQVFRAMGCEVEELFCQVDGYFPNHHPDPADPANLDALISLVRLQRADLGLAFDGDGDRLGVVDARGRIIWPDRQLMLFARDVLARAPGAHVVYDVKCSAKLGEYVSELGGVPLMWKSGHSMIRSKMREVDALLAGDMSGHIFLKDRWYGFDDAIYAGARVLEILSSEDRGSVEMFVGLPDALSTPEIRIDLAPGEAEQIMAALGDGFAESFEDARVTAIDGIRIDLEDGWGLVRASNTQPCLVLRFEADDKVAMGRIQEAFRSQLLTIRPDLALPF